MCNNLLGCYRIFGGGIVTDIFNEETISRIYSSTRRSVNITVSNDKVIIKLDWQSYFQIEKVLNNMHTIYRLFYIERGDKLNYGDYFNGEDLVNSIIAKLN